MEDCSSSHVTEAAPPKEGEAADALSDNTYVSTAGEGEVTLDTSIYGYIKQDLFTSEIFKVEIRNLPKFIGFNDLKKFLAKHGLNPHKIKLFGKHTFAFVTFKNEEERNKAVKMVHGMQWKGQVLSVKLAKPKADPIQRKRKQEEAEGLLGQPPSKQAEGNDKEEPPSVQIANVVTPLWNVPYEQQLKRKEEDVVAVLQRLAKEIASTNRAMVPWLFEGKGKQNRMCCPLEAICPSPTQTEYRNKCEFLISVGADGEDKTIGFRLGKYKGGSCAVVGPAEVCHVSAEAKKVVHAFQKFIRSTPYTVYSPEMYEGHWKQLTVRTTRTKQAMAIVFFNPQKLRETELGALKNSMKEYFSEGEGKDSGITSLYFVREGQRKSPNVEDLPCELVAGDSWIHEELLGLTFRISPHSFFQVNTAGAEVLYSAVGEWAQLDQDSIVLDVCCGTGTIGISLAKRVKKVIGIELCQEAVEDAKVNAKLNGLSNVEFHCGKAEDLFPNILSALVSPKVTAIVDPPRAGLHSKVILAIRRAEHLKRLIYVACNAKAAMNNFIDLCRSPSNRVHGAPFQPVRAIAVDMFPQTTHFEMVMLFERVDYNSQQQMNNQKEALSSS
ncbi:tRNA (uracil-5-)-methyltransferase homolog A [Syngnathoides biaculeatus]|uniref:tRNA (uracil-5-)-methyltransferase homolog A n=1 Tax=Syngnathoides biaculeatus TaxID=300417 RepID=UPI002ADD94C4|nr:tRNA (uracil-5-)-methyltransferase homolog A [Syngnathoides biaculeatus]XP_061674604.1 tRNA (uracil-5-)-methyltransferase homolog A [Syngnathoides biaculeatus]XP_061674605.1 tRNA (uracil-5-)-methyltransferase homolog A [Syngnathoides biaculeatus]XP_061674606.1 tRNA (uracil-5-)-methyltransferase homolog A [Syngnathoides biaculeatus]XP_061674607.1 tRNA (uracil-5-)-methyltransferase homolog A [Syngnathoides biaculeatus]XP_061674609.1 tRNA (uracil-5-)-methyltransferase homolog A [Syngnathoides 